MIIFYISIIIRNILI